MKNAKIQFYPTPAAIAADAHSFAAGYVYRVVAVTMPCPGCGVPTECRQISFRDNGEPVCTLVLCTDCYEETQKAN